MYSPSSSASFSSSCSIDTGHGSRSIHSSIRPASSNHSNHGNDFCSSSSSSHHRWSPMPCNKCRQPIDATAFVCSCDCLFCDECTYNHFNTNANCPNCGRILGENDFTEVTVSDPDSKISNDPNGIVQSLLTKTSKQPGATIAWNDVFAALLREHHTLERNYRFFVNQFVRETDRHSQEGHNNMRQCEIYRKQLAASKIDIISFQKRHEENTERLRQKDRQLVEKDRQIQQLKRMLAQNNNTNSSGNGGRSSGSGLSSFRPPGSSSSAASSSSSSAIHESHHRPFQHYVRKKEERELAQERDLLNLTRKKNIIMPFGRQR
ncbi:hypothetical protein FRACYDRAFT_242026 [Fragilariopsis cylindrus CCMP1102]|uniref:RING-type domain-containing protein n=1 Tax=Fragilariopsis cylindrus CCMP1102 TaxID=635003 RepID=A0A1E7F679_9STRA|nr:hypothetical protein FRACYDRAFT_242026 [Fragilariopsis cylindrus CCMP1102]|eukprot:OEU13682.1 hypothetical protein FRACYDRAFT_242026 [Fragilariopsis cylindrus CCMP1102]